jgi:hypothetical protein
VELNPKSLSFVIAALQHYMEWHDEQLRRTDLSDDERSDLTNDRYYLESLRDGFRQWLDAATGRGG